MEFKVTIIRAEGLKNVEKKGESDPFVQFKFRGEKYKTQYLPNTLNPEWNKEFPIDLKDKAITGNERIELNIYDWERVGRNRLLGQVEINLAKVIRERNDESWHMLRDKSGGAGEGRVLVRITYVASSAEKLSGIEGGAGPSHSSATPNVSNPSGDGDDDENSDDDGGDPADGDDDFDSDGGDPADPDAPPGTKKKKGKGRRNKPRTLRKTRPKNLSDVVGDYQVRITIHEARSLQGQEPLDPVIKLNVASKMRQTRVKRTTNHPFFNELFIFNFNEAPVNLFPELIEISAYNSRRLRKDALIGTFSFDIGVVHQEPTHEFHRKWVMIVQKGEGETNATGFVKMSVAVLGPGDEAAVHDDADTAVDEDEDIDGNLLQPGGVELQPVDMLLRAYRAEDLPQMDRSFKTGIRKLDKLSGREDRELCDPYLIYGFAGKKMKTEVKPTTYVPDWNIEMHLPVKLPSMCDSLRLRLMDHDIGPNADDIIGTHNISLLHISNMSSDEESSFLPTFGPAYVNFYGSPREFEAFTDKHHDRMNTGMIEGCAYRGRALVEVASDPTSKPPKNRHIEIDKPKLNAVDAFLARKPYRLRVEFVDATMLCEECADTDIEFEVSIGPTGDSLDEHYVPGMSSTQPTRAAFDGTHYYYLSWDGKKPIVELTSEWESVEYRLHNVNVIKDLVTQIEESVDLLQRLANKTLTVEMIAAMIVQGDSRLLSQDLLDELERSVNEAEAKLKRRVEAAAVKAATAKAASDSGEGGVLSDDEDEDEDEDEDALLAELQRREDDDEDDDQGEGWSSQVQTAGGDKVANTAAEEEEEYRMALAADAGPSQPSRAKSSLVDDNGGASVPMGGGTVRVKQEKPKTTKLGKTLGRIGRLTKAATAGVVSKGIDVAGQGAAKLSHMHSHATTATRAAEIVEYDPRIVRARGLLRRLMRLVFRKLPKLPSPRTQLDTHMHSWREDEKDAALERLKEIRKAMCEKSLEVAPEPVAVNNSMELVDTGAAPAKDYVREALEMAADDLQGIAGRLRKCAVEPQVSIPDIFVWLRRGKDRDRVAYCRFSPIDVMYAHKERMRGANFGRLQTVIMKRHEDTGRKNAGLEIPALLMMRVWFGDAASSVKWPVPDGRYCGISETFENQRFYPLKGWSDTTLMGERPHWSSVKGNEPRPRDECSLPEGWVWVSDWYISPTCIETDPDVGRDVITEEVYENMRYVPIKGWGKVIKGDRPTFSDETGDIELDRDDVELPKHWMWSDEWHVDVNRAVDHDGWEYATNFGAKNWHPSKKRMHFVRRRRWARERSRTAAGMAAAAGGTGEGIDDDAMSVMSDLSTTSQVVGEGWEYARGFEKKFHKKNRRVDVVRRRRWHRERVCEAGRVMDPKDLTINGFGAGGYVVHIDSTVVQMRAHIYQGRDLPGEDKSGLSDPYIHIAFGNRSAKSLIFKQTVGPTWDQTLTVNKVRVWGSDEHLVDNLPKTVVELYDWDRYGEDAFLGRFMVKGKLRELGDSPPRLEWYKMKRANEERGELLAAFEVILADTSGRIPLPMREIVQEQITGHRKPVTRIPVGIRPVMESVCLDILTWGLRRLSKVRGIRPKKVHVQFECSGIVVDSNIITSMKTFPNFPYPFIRMELELPVVDEYMPPLTIRVYDHGKVFGQTLIGVHQVRTLAQYRRTAKEILDLRRRPIGSSIAEVHLKDDAATTAAGVAGTSDAVAVTMEPKAAAAPTEVTTTGAEDAAVAVGGGAIEMKQMQPVVKKGKKAAAVTAAAKAEEDKAKATKAALEAEAAAAAVAVVTAGEGGDGAGADGATGAGAGGVSASDALAVVAEEVVEAESADFQTVDWWTKFFASLDRDHSKGPSMVRDYKGDRLTVFKRELEREFFLEDTVEAFNVAKGRESNEHKETGTFKGAIAVYPATIKDEVPPGGAWPNLPSNQCTDMLVRVYIVRGIELQPQDPNGKSDPYIMLKLGKKVIEKDRDNYVVADLNPTFGRMFQFVCTFPQDDELTVTVMDWDRITSDDLIGETKIDLEARFLSHMRATAGLPRTYTTTGPLKWRDAELPVAILESMCRRRNLPPPAYTVDTEGEPAVTLNGRRFVSPIEPEDDDSAHQNAALQALHAMGLVPEHVETRPLWSPMQPDIEQGKLQMWVDMFPLSLGIPPPPVNIEPRKPREYELRIVVWDTVDCEFRDVNLFGEKMSDLYVKCFMKGLEKQKQKTDVHYRSLNGEGNFNWRMKFPFSYIPQEDTVVVTAKEHFYSLNKTTQKFAPMLSIQIWDNDIFSKDDYIGMLDLKLSDFKQPPKKSKKVVLEGEGTEKSEKKKDKEATENVNIFECRRVRGWFPVYYGAGDERRISGKADLEIELLTKQESEDRPNANARQDPNAFPTLDKPNRPETSFFWLTNPWKSLKYILWPNLKWYIIALIIIVLIVVFLLLLWWTLPTAVVNKLVI